MRYSFFGVRPAASVAAFVGGAVLLATPAAHAQFNTNLLVNGNAESGSSDSGGNTVASIPGFTATDGATVVPYGAAGGFPTLSDPGPTNRGTQFFAGGPTSTTSTLSQTVSLAFAASAIDAGSVTFDLSGYLGGFSTQGDNATLTISFAAAGGQGVVGSTTIGPVTTANRGNLTGLLFRQAFGAVPAGARSATALVTFTRTDGSYNDGYADNLAYSVAATGAPEPGTLPLLGMGLLTGASLFSRGRGTVGTVRGRKAKEQAAPRGN